MIAAIGAKSQPSKDTAEKCLSIPLSSTNTVEDPAIEDAAHTLSLKDTSITSVGRLSPLPQAHPNVDLLFTSPIFNYTPFDAVSLLDDHSDSTDDFILNTDLRGGLTNVNYDFDLSDHSAENSVAEDLKLNLQQFDPLAQKPDQEPGLEASTDIRTPDNSLSLLDSDSPTNGTLLPSPLKPTVTDYRGFSRFEIPSISCNTGDFASLNHSINEQIDNSGSLSTVSEKGTKK